MPIPSRPAHEPPESIGPYRLGERLGRGGMGEVYRGYDARLDRPVALKRVHPEVGDPAVALRRFQREARAAARLRHPAIVQVHDWVETGDEAWLVMELVEGISLRELLRAGPLEPGRAIGLAHDLLEGLAVAHDAGLVHRDLKTENVMISPGSTAGRGRGEQAKILDFGLAKQAAPTEEETRLSVEGKIIGTLSALAPEQVMGGEVDGRTDLFALGCLLYETLTGLQPFVGRTAGETLNRICTAHPVPVHLHRPQVSLSLSSFIDHLLQKDPRRRPVSAHDALDALERVSSADLGSGLPALTADGLPTEVAGLPPPTPPVQPARPRPRRWHVAALGAAGLLVALLAWWRWSEAGPSTGTTYVVVPETTLEAPAGHDVTLAARAIHAALLQGLVDLQGIAALQLPAGAATDDPRQTAREMAADELLTSSLACDERSCRALLQRVGGTDGRVLWAQAFSADPAQLLELSRAVLGFLPAAFPDHRRRRGAADLEVRPADYETYLRLFQRFLDRDHGLSSDELLAELARLGTSSPRFPGVPMLETEASLQRFQATRESTDLERAERALERARTLAPADPKVGLLAARTAREAGDVQTAAARLEEVRRLEPGNVEAVLEQALLAESTGEIERALALAREAVAKRPSTALLLNVSDLFSRHGDAATARRHVELALERAPKAYGALSRLAQLELSHGDLERSAELYGQLVERSAETTELTNLGTALMMLGRFDEAAERFLAVAQKTPSSPFAVLNLADVEQLRGRRERAAELYAQVVEQVANDPQPQRLASVQAQALAHLGRREEAVAAMQEALRRQGDHPWIAYEAALVFALVDDRSSALWNARRALALGIEPRWFALPWFDSVRGSIEAER